MTISEEERQLLNKMNNQIKDKSAKVNDDLEEVCKKFDKETKAKKQELNKKKWTQRKKTYNKWTKRTNAVLDWIEGPPPKKTHKTQNKPQQTRYVIQNGVAYPIARTRSQSHKKPVKKKKKKAKDPFDFNIKW